MSEAIENGGYILLDADSDHMRTHTTEIDVRFRDLDTMGHVNNALYVTYLEEARVDFFRSVFEASLSDVDSVLASVSIDYLAPIELGDRPVIELTIEDVGRSSITMSYEIVVDDETVATAETVQVMYDPDTDSSRPIPAEWCDRLQPYL